MGADAYIGDIIMFAGNFAPRSWAFCDGQLMQISQYSALFSILGTTYGGDGRTTFALPDLRGRIPMHEGSGPGLTPRTLGEKGGVEAVVLTSAQMPAHDHMATAHSVAAAGNSNQASGTLWANDAGTQSATYSNAAANATMNAAAVTTAIAGGSQPHPNVQPFLCVNFIICIEGIYPPRS